MGVLSQIPQRHPRVFEEHLADHRKLTVEGFNRGVYLDSVAGAEHQNLGHPR